MSLKSYCEENNRLYILREWDTEKNLPLTPDAIAHTSATPVWWKCEKGHSWCTQIRSRSRSSTGCPKCREEKLEEKRQRHIKEARKCYWGEGMIYCCEDCGFLFQRVGEVQTCPFCEGQHLRPAMPEEPERLRSLLKTRDKEEENA